MELMLLIQMFVLDMDYAQLMENVSVMLNI